MAGKMFSTGMLTAVLTCAGVMAGLLCTCDESGTFPSATRVHCCSGASLVAQAQSHTPSPDSRATERKAKRNARSVQSPSTPDAPRDGDTEIEFVVSERAFWNTRSVSNPAFSDGSVNAVMFSRDKRVQDLNLDKLGGQSELEVTGGRAPAVTVNGKDIQRRDKPTEPTDGDVPTRPTRK